MFSADLTIAFVLVTVLSVSCSFGGWSIQIQRLEEGEFWIPTCVEFPMGWPSSYVAPHGLLACFISSQDPVLHGWCQKGKWNVSLKNMHTCGGMADVLIAARDWLFFSQSQVTLKVTL